MLYNFTIYLAEVKSTQAGGTSINEIPHDADFVKNEASTLYGQNVHPLMAAAIILAKIKPT